MNVARMNFSHGTHEVSLGWAVWPLICLARCSVYLAPVDQARTRLGFIASGKMAFTSLFIPSLLFLSLDISTGHVALNKDLSMAMVLSHTWATISPHKRKWKDSTGTLPEPLGALATGLDTCTQVSVLAHNAVMTQKVTLHVDSGLLQTKITGQVQENGFHYGKLRTEFKALAGALLASVSQRTNTIWHLIPHFINIVFPISPFPRVQVLTLSQESGAVYKLTWPYQGPGGSYWELLHSCSAPKVRMPFIKAFRLNHKSWNLTLALIEEYG